MMWRTSQLKWPTRLDRKLLDNFPIKIVATRQNITRKVAVEVINEFISCYIPFIVHSSPQTTRLSSDFRAASCAIVVECHNEPRGAKIRWKQFIWIVNPRQSRTRLVRKDALRRILPEQARRSSS